MNCPKCEIEMNLYPDKDIFESNETLFICPACNERFGLSFLKYLKKEELTWCQYCQSFYCQLDNPEC